MRTGIPLLSSRLYLFSKPSRETRITNCWNTGSFCRRRTHLKKPVCVLFCKQQERPCKAAFLFMSFSAFTQRRSATKTGDIILLNCSLFGGDTAAQGLFFCFFAFIPRCKKNKKQLHFRRRAKCYAEFRRGCDRIFFFFNLTFHFFFVSHTAASFPSVFPRLSSSSAGRLHAVGSNNCCNTDQGLENTPILQLTVMRRVDCFFFVYLEQQPQNAS